MGRNDIVDPRLGAELSAFYPDLCTIEELPASDDEEQSDLGAPLEDWTPVAGLENLACAIGPTTTDRPSGAQERRGKMAATISNAFTISFPAYHEGITSRHRAVVNDVAYAILGNAEHDSLRTITRLNVEIVSS